MNKTLSNKFFSAEIKSEGAELVSFKNTKDGCEYVWYGDKNYWTGHSPVLFPIVCAVKNGEMKIDGVTYKIGNHGFARKSEFELVEENDSKAVYKLTYSDATLAMYPYRFELFISYTLTGNKLQIEYKVVNTDDKTIYFQLGTHPGFNCPLDDSSVFEDYYIEFDQTENLRRHYFNSANLLISSRSDVLELIDSRVLPLNHEMFHDGAIVVKNVNSGKVSLKNYKNGKSVVLTYEDLPHMGIWQPKNAPFICIEPWHGLADTDDFDGEFKEKELIVNLEKGASYKCSLAVEIF